MRESIVCMIHGIKYIIFHYLTIFENLILFQLAPQPILPIYITYIQGSKVAHALPCFQHVLLIEQSILISHCVVQYCYAVQFE